MAKRTGPTTLELKNLVADLKTQSREKNAKIWKAIAKNLEKPTRQRCSVNISKINRYATENEIIVVPGKVLSQGNLNHKVTVAAYQFSQAAKDKLKDTISIQELMKKNPTGKGVKIIC